MDSDIKFYKFGIKCNRANEFPDKYDDESLDQFGRPTKCSPPVWVFKKTENFTKKDLSKEIIDKNIEQFKWCNLTDVLWCVLYCKSVLLSY